MLDHEYDTMREVEDTYWWYRALRGHVAKELAVCLAGRQDATVLDAGCGTGGMLAMLKEGNPEWNLHGVDISRLAIDHARERGLENLFPASVDTLPMPAATFDAVISLDVLYHSGVDDKKSINEFTRVLKANGFLVLNLPALDCLSGRHDVAVSGARRYSLPQVRTLLQKQNLHILQLHYWDAWLFPPLYLWRQISRLLPRTANETIKSDLAHLPRTLNSILARISRADILVSRALGFRFGTSVFAIAVKK